MANTRIVVTGLDRLIRKLNATTKDTMIMESLYLSGLQLARWSKDNRLSGPRPGFLGVKTGRLRSSISVAKTIKRGNSYRTKIGTNVIYARIHEFGGKNMPERPFLRPALEDKKNQKDVVKILKTRLLAEVKKQV